MKPDDNVCLCFHVPYRKLVQYVRIEKPVRASQMSHCGGAGTGCGWCVPILERIFQETTDSAAPELPDAQDWSDRRTRYLARGKTREE